MRTLSGVLDSVSSQRVYYLVLFLPRGQKSGHVAERQQLWDTLM